MYGLIINEQKTKYIVVNGKVEGDATEVKQKKKTIYTVIKGLKVLNIWAQSQQTKMKRILMQRRECRKEVEPWKGR